MSNTAQPTVTSSKMSINPGKDLVVKSSDQSAVFRVVVRTAGGTSVDVTVGPDGVCKVVPGTDCEEITVTTWPAEMLNRQPDGERHERH